MKRYTLEKLPNVPVIVWIGHEDLNWERDMPVIAAEMMRLLDAQTARVFCIADFTLVASKTFSDVVFVTNLAARSGAAFLRHPNLIEFLVVTQDRVIELAVRGLRSDIYGNVSTQVFRTFAEALEYAVSQ